MPVLHRILAALTVLIVGVLVAGCGGGGDEGGGGSATVAAGDTVEVAGGEYFFDPETIEVEGPGEVSIDFANEGSLAHNLTVLDGDQEIGATSTFEGGESDSLTLDLESGSYEMICTVGSHAAQGMTGQIEVP